MFEASISEQDHISLEDRLSPAVMQQMAVESVTRGGQEQGYALRFRGRLLRPSQAAFAALEPLFQAQGHTLLMRKDGEQDLILATPGVIQGEETSPASNIILFFATLLSVIVAGLFYAAEMPTTPGVQGWMESLLRALPEGLFYALSLMAILLAHEFGHYLTARHHGTPVSLPYFIPLPVPGTFGTLGAFIRLKSPPRNKRTLLDVGIAGPLAGLAVAIPVLLIGLSLSEVGPLQEPESGTAIMMEGNSLLYLGAKYLVKGELLPAPESYGPGGPLAYIASLILRGGPIPFGGRDVTLHPMAWAGWAGLLVTALNLIPAGQLDGGHTIYVLIGKRAARLLPFIITGLLLLGLVWTGWFIWAALLFFMGRVFAQPLDEITELDPRRRAIAILGMLLFVLVFIPVPLQVFGDGF